MKKALLDGDMIIHMCAAAQQISIDWDGDGDKEVYWDVEEVARAVFKMSRDWTRKAGCRDYAVCLSTGTNYRNKVLPSYKANRAGVEKPKAFYDVLEIVRREEEVMEEPGLEADDIMGIYGSGDRDKYVVVSRDKDMMSIPGWISNPDRNDGKPCHICTLEADRFFLTQALCGDPVDGYTGIPKVGKVKAEKLLTNPVRTLKKVTTISRGKNAGKQKITWVDGDECSTWEAMVTLAESKGMTEAELLKQAQVARILRAGEYGWETKTIQLWHPQGKRIHIQND